MRPRNGAMGIPGLAYFDRGPAYRKAGDQAEKSWAGSRGRAR
jgi:hypothetical protein